ncbi:MAG: hypothetical protein V3R25_09225 [Nitrosomonadaceae bacterium]
MNEVDKLSDKREKITQLVDFMKGLPQTECPVIHRFAPNCYIREIKMWKDTYVVGKIHATKHFNTLLKGDVTVITSEGMERRVAGDTFVSEAGVQKIVYMHEDCIWQTIHVTNKTDLAEIEKEIIVESYDQLEVDGLLDQARLLA